MDNVNVLLTVGNEVMHKIILIFFFFLSSNEQKDFIWINFNKYNIENWIME